METAPALRDTAAAERILFIPLNQRIEAVDFEAAKQDVVPFVSRPRDLEVWSKEYFRRVVGKLECVNLGVGGLPV